MSWNGSGTFVRLYSWIADKAGSINITASRMDADTNDIVANGLGNCITRDGQGQPTANLPMAGFRHTGASPAVGSGDYMTLGQFTGGTFAISATTLTASTSLTVTAGGAAITGNSSVNGTFTVSTGVASFTANATVTGTLGVSGAATFGSIAGTTLTGTTTNSGTINGGSVTNLASPLGVASGGSGRATNTNHAVLIGQGTGAFNAAAPNTAGWVLTDNGPSADPSFQAPAGGVTTFNTRTGAVTLTTADVGSAMAGIAVGAVGSMIFAGSRSGSTIAKGATVAGSNLRGAILSNGAALALTDDGVALSGTWQNMGGPLIAFTAGCPTIQGFGLFLRTV